MRRVSMALSLGAILLGAGCRTTAAVYEPPPDSPASAAALDGSVPSAGAGLSLASSHERQQAEDESHAAHKSHGGHTRVPTPSDQEGPPHVHGH